METNFKGTKGKWNADGMEVYITDGYEMNLIIAETSYDLDVLGKKTCSRNAELIAEAGNVRQQINCSLTELLEQRNELLEALENTIFRMTEQLSLSQIKVNKTEFEREVSIAKKAIERTKNK